MEAFLFIFLYLVILVVGGLSFIAFWGAVIYVLINLLGAHRGAVGASSYADISREADTRLGAMGGPLPR